MAIGSVAWLRNLECRFFPGRRRTVVICRSRFGFISGPQMEWQSDLDHSYYIINPTYRMVSLHHESAQSCPCSAGSRRRRHVQWGRRIYQSRKFPGLHLGQYHVRTKSKFVLGYRSRTFSADGRSIPVGTLYRQKRTIRYKRNTPAFLGKGSYYCCNLFRSLVFLKRTDHGKRQCLDQANRRDSFRHVAEICVYIRPRFLVCTLIPERMLQESCFSSAFLR